MLSTRFVSAENQQVIWKVLSQMEVFQSIPTEEESIAFFRKHIGHTYEELNRLKVPYNMLNLQDTNRHVLRQMVEELKKRRQVHLPTPPVKSAPMTMSDMFETRKQEYEAANSKPVLPENPFELPKDEPLSNMDELIEQHKTGRTEIPPTFSAFDAARMTMNPLLVSKSPQEHAQVIADIQRQLGELRDEVSQIRKIVQLRDTAYTSSNTVSASSTSASLSSYD
jgi:hypothetical protein